MANKTAPTREERLKELEALTTEDLLKEAKAAKLTITKKGARKPFLVNLILGAEYGLGEVPGAPNGADQPTGAPAASQAPQKGTASVKKPKPEAEEEDENPLSSQHKEIDTQLGQLYDGLVEQIKAVAVEGVQTDSAEQMRAGAVQFLRQCNAVLESARQLLESGKSVVEQNNKQLQGIEAAKADLEKRSAAYSLMTGKGGEAQE